MKNSNPRLTLFGNLAAIGMSIFILREMFIGHLAETHARWVPGGLPHTTGSIIIFVIAFGALGFWAYRRHARRRRYWH